MKFQKIGYERGVLPPPGVYYDVPEDIYHSWAKDATGKVVVSGSLLKRLADTWPRAFKAYLDNPAAFDKKTPAMEFGTAAHSAILEPAAFDKKYVVAPEFGDLRKTENKQKKAAWQLDNSGRLPCDADDFTTITTWRNIIREDRVAKEIVYGPGYSEVVIVWKHLSGFMVRCRIDRVAGYTPQGQKEAHSVHGEIKTTKATNTREFANEIATRYWHLSAYLYNRGSEELFQAQGRTWPTVFIGLLKGDFPDVATYELDANALEAGGALAERLIGELYEYDKANVWPGPTGGMLEPITLPGWAMAKKGRW